MDGWFEAMGRHQLEGGTHHGGLDGMLDENEMQRFDLANSRDGQRIFLEGVIRHHTGAIEWPTRRSLTASIQGQLTWPRTSA
jgi:uncharacterized protein (DUF305 family)